MGNSKFVLSFVLSFTVLISQFNFAQANTQTNTLDADTLTVTVTEVTDTNDFADPTPEPLLPAPGGDLPNPGGGGLLPLPGDDKSWGGGGIGCIPGITCNDYGGGFDFGTILTLGQKVWDFIVTNKGNADYQTMKGSVLPGGATDWTQLKGWSKPVSKVYNVQFKNVFGKDAGGFKYRIVFVYGGNHQGKGKYIGQISFAPSDIVLKTDRQLHVRAELLDALNFGTEEDPIAGAQLLITWHTSTTFKYTMNSIEHFLYGTGEVQDLTNGNLQLQ